MNKKPILFNEYPNHKMMQKKPSFDDLFFQTNITTVVFLCILFNKFLFLDQKSHDISLGGE